MLSFTIRRWDMAMIRFNNIHNPFERLFKLQKELDRYFNKDLFPVPSTSAYGLFPAINLFEMDNNFIVTMELPGFKEDEVNLEILDKQLKIDGKRKFDFDEKNVTFHRRERQWGHFNRSITLPDKVNREKVSANMKDGILKITIAKADEVVPKQIQINIGE